MAPRVLALVLALVLAGAAAELAEELVGALRETEEEATAVGAAPSGPATFHHAAKVRSVGRVGAGGEARTATRVCVPQTRCSCPHRCRGGCLGATWWCCTRAAARPRCEGRHGGCRPGRLGGGT